MRLAMLPNRVVTAGKIRNAVIHSEPGRKGVNQDTMLAWADFQEGGGEEDTDLIAVFDGHGTHGHLVATRVRDSIGSRIAASWHSVGQMNGNGTADLDPDTAANSTAEDTPGNDCAYLAADVAVQTVASENGIPEAAKSAAADRWHRAITEAFLAMDREIRAHPCMDAHMSGTAAVMMLRQVGGWVGMGHMLDVFGLTCQILAGGRHGPPQHSVSKAALAFLVTQGWSVPFFAGC